MERSADEQSLTPPLDAKLFGQKSINSKQLASGFSLYDDDDDQVDMVRPLFPNSNNAEKLTPQQKSNSCALEDGELNESCSPFDATKLMKSKGDDVIATKTKALDALKAYVDIETNQEDSDSDNGSSTNKKSPQSKTVFSRNRSRGRSKSDDKVHRKKRKKDSSGSERRRSSKSVDKTKYRKSNERDRQFRRDRSGKRDTPRRDRSEQRQYKGSESRRKSNHFNDNRRNRSKNRFCGKSGQPNKEPPANREMRLTVSLPVISYCENGRFASFEKNNSKNSEPKQKIRRLNDVVNVVKTYDEEEQENGFSENGGSEQLAKTPEIPQKTNQFSSERSKSREKSAETLEISPKRLSSECDESSRRSGTPDISPKVSKLLSESRKVKSHQEKSIDNKASSPEVGKPDKSSNDQSKAQRSPIPQTKSPLQSELSDRKSKSLNDCSGKPVPHSEADNDHSSKEPKKAETRSMCKNVDAQESPNDAESQRSEVKIDLPVVQKQSKLPGNIDKPETKPHHRTTNKEHSEQFHFNNNSKTLTATTAISEDKMKRYIDEYDSFMECVSSPLRREPQNQDQPKAVENVAEQTENDFISNDASTKRTSMDNTDEVVENAKKETENLLETKKSTARQNRQKKSTSSSSSSSSDSSDSDSSSDSSSSSSSSSASQRKTRRTNSSSSSSSTSSSTSSSSTDSSDSSTDDEKTKTARKRKRRKSTSSSSKTNSSTANSRSVSLSPRIRKSKSKEKDKTDGSLPPIENEQMTLTDGLTANCDFSVHDNHSVAFGTNIVMVKQEVDFESDYEKGAIAIDSSKNGGDLLKSLLDLNVDDDSDLLLNQAKLLRNRFLQTKKAKLAASEKSRADEAYLPTEYENGADHSKAIKQEGVILLDDADRKKVSLQIKSTTSALEPLKPQVDLETGEEPVKTEQIEQSASEKEDVSVKSKSSMTHRGKNEDRKSRRSEDRRTNRSEERRARRSEERKHRSSKHRSPKRSDRHSSKDRDRNRRSRERQKKERRRDRSPSFNRSDRRYSASPKRYSPRERSSRKSVSPIRREASPHRAQRRSNSPSYRNDRKRSYSPLHRNERNRSISPYRRRERDRSYSPYYRQGKHRSNSPLPRGPRTPPNTPPPSEFDEHGGRNRILHHDERHISSPYDHHMANVTKNLKNTPPGYHHIPVQCGLNNSFHSQNLPPNMSQYMMNEYANPYMHPNRPSTMSPQLCHPHHRPSHETNIPVLGSGDGFFYQTNTMSLHPHQPHLANQPPTPFSNLIEVPQTCAPHSNMVDCMRKPTENSRKRLAIAVQKGNVLEIVPNSELQCDKNAEIVENEKHDKVLSAEKQQQQQAMYRQRDRYKRKVERQQRRLAKEKRKQYLLSEIEQLSRQLIVGEDGKMIRAGDLLRNTSFDGTSPHPDKDKEDNYVEPPTYNYNPQAEVGKSILAERNDKAMNDKLQRRKLVLFADGVKPGEGTSSENSSNEDDEKSVKPKKLSTRIQNKKKRLNSDLPISYSSPVLGKENAFDSKKLIGEKEVKNEEEIVPPPPPGSPPPHLRQPTLKNPDKFIVNQLIYFHYNYHGHSMYVSPSPFPSPYMASTTTPPPSVPKIPTTPVPVIQPTVQPPPIAYSYKSSNGNGSRSSEAKLSKSNRVSTSKHYSAHKSIHTSIESNLIAIQPNSPSSF